MRTPGTPWKGAAGRKDRISTLLRAPSIPSIAQAQQDPESTKPLDAEILTQLRQIWWRQATIHHNRMPAEPGVIVFSGMRL